MQLEHLMLRGGEDNPFVKLLQLDALTNSILLGTCIAGCIIGSVYAECYKNFSATQVTVASNIIKFLTVFVGCVVFGNRLSLLQNVGLTISILAGVWYSILPKETRSIKTDSKV